MNTLYQLTAQYAELLGRLDDAPEEYGEIIAAIEAVDEAITDKAEAYARIIQSKRREAAACDVEIRRLTTRKTSAETLADNLSLSLLEAMRTANASKISTSIGTWTLKRNPPKVVIVDEKQIPEEYLVPQPPKVSKTAIMSTFSKTGEIIPGTDIVHGQRVEFR